MNAQDQLRILICRLSHLGDCVLTLPMVHALRQSRPDAYIAWAVEPPADQLLTHHPDVDELIRVPKRWVSRWSTFRQVRRELRRFKFDLAIDPQCICKSSVLAWASGAPSRLGFAGVHGRELSKWFNNQWVTPRSAHLVDRSLELLQGLGIEPEGAVFKLPIENAALDETDRFIADQGITDRFVAMNPGASWRSKQWECDRFAAVARFVQKRFRLNTVVTWAGDAELDQALAIVRDSAGAAKLAWKTDLQRLSALLYRSQLYVGCDTGPTHIAAALGTTCVVLYGPTRPQDSGAYGPQHYAVQARYQSGTCRQRRSADNDAMRDISVQLVNRTCETALEQLRRRNPADAA